MQHACGNRGGRTAMLLHPSVTGRAPVEGIVFDLDGVLIQSRAAHAEAFREVLADFGIHDFEYDRFAGWRTPEVFRAVFTQHTMPAGEEVVAECSRRKSERARAVLASGDFLEPGCVAAIEELAGRYRVALASSGSRESVQSFLDRTGLTFQSVLTGDDVTNAKPDPEIFRRSIEALGVRPENCVVVEDAVAGVQAARAAGARAIGFSAENGEQLTAAGASIVVRSLEELLRTL